MTNRIVVKPVKKQYRPPEYECAYIAKPIVMERAPIEVTNGHGEWSTRWKGCF
jgi:hypothetical protein